MEQMTWTIIACVLVLVHMCLGQKGCPGVDCPRLDNCLEEVLVRGACCATCLQRGCTCEGYQYYDCISAGFHNGKVPEGESYLVDSGSTECQCPTGGGRISCRFIPCPDVPPHCIELSETTEACPHCLRFGCLYKKHKYEAGHSFHLNPCQVCHCPNDGGDLMCSVVPGCSSQTLKNPKLKKNELQISKHGNGGDFLREDQSNWVQIYTENTSESEEREHYDYFPDTIPSSADPQAPNPHDVLHETTRKELKETLVLYDTEPGEEETEDSPNVSTIQTNPRSSEKFSSQTETIVRLTQVPPHETKTSTTEDIRRTEKTPEDHWNLLETIPELITVPEVHIVSTTSAPVSVREPETQGQPQTMGRYNQERNKLHPTSGVQQRVTSREVSVCCAAGENWATVHGLCNSMVPKRTEPGSTCWLVQVQCCLNAMRERRCSFGMNTARQGRDCGTDDVDLCDSHTECCKCCALGLRLRAQRESCDHPRGLGETCSHALLTCCKETRMTNHSAVWERTHPRATSPPRRVSEGPEHEEFFLEEDSENIVEDTENVVEMVEDTENVVEDTVKVGEDTENMLEDTENMRGNTKNMREDTANVLEKINHTENVVEKMEELQDVDECSVYAGKLCHHQCVNTQGSYVCVCFPGFVLQPDGIQCVAQARADDESRLKDVHTAGLRPAETSTMPPPDLPHPCDGNSHCAHHCHLVDSQAHCSCFPGFSLMPDGHSCEDVDECILSIHSCHLKERCVNTVGSFTCLQQIICLSGYQLRNNLCEDINECTLGAHSCRPGFECINTAGSFSCRARPRCPGGFTHDSQGQCVDIDECRTVTQPCSTGFNCVNTIGSYTCQRKIILCGRGYHSSPDGTRCIDIDECEAGVHHCGEGQICHNIPGTYRCDCHQGYQYDTFQRMCLDVNECWQFSGRLCAQTCENTPGSYRCSCTSGFTLSSDGKSCEDVNECLSSQCSHECVNIYGSYRCYCRQGYYLNEDAHTCEDIDECSQSIGPLCSYKCVNVPGSYTCACPEHGYSMASNQRSCNDIDECAVGAHNCTAKETCYNIQGGFRCLSFSCPTNYHRASDTRCERISCLTFVECQNSPARITYYQVSFQMNIIVPALIFRMGPSPAYSGDNIIISIRSGDEDGYFSPRKLNTYTGAIYLQRQLPQPRDFLLDVEMKLWRQGTFTTFLARIYVFITPNVM